MKLLQKAFKRKNNTQPDNTKTSNVANTRTIINETPINLDLELISERHVACVFLLDTSGSMNKDGAIDKLAAGIRAFREQTMNNQKTDEVTRACIDIACVTYGGDVCEIQPFTTVDKMIVPTLVASGGTPMGEAINKGLDMITAQKAKYNEYGTPYFRPWLFNITDGGPTDDYSGATIRLKKMEAEKKVLGYCVGVENFNRNAMATIFEPERLFELKNLNFPSLFQFVSSSLLAILQLVTASKSKHLLICIPLKFHSKKGYALC